MSPIIETSRLLLREFTLEDIADVYAFGSNEVVNRYTGDPLMESPAQARKVISDTWLVDYKTYGYGRWALIYKPEKKLIGFVGLKYLSDIQETDIGYRLLPDYWGKGIATEAAKEVLAYGQQTLGIKRIIGIAFPENIASCRVLEKIGLKWYKTADYPGENKTLHWYQTTEVEGPEQS